MSAKKQIHLSKRAYLIHNWLCLYQGGRKSTLKLREFQAWAEQHTGTSHSLKDIHAALDELTLHDLITIYAIELETHDIDLNTFVL
ncbi:hypothetical protein C7B82_28440 [Stenomitos frigidus ULC18]|uniref:Uncharacterized protein n=1 Tax=Stenomitos frigidus ULC18 TaxID=2107698 RepID=A0A2T1DUM2_9CYAN|nr:hypothetical protein C7B82_28440 [Stenomitos frigidus ULC18]